jgi:YtkA-like protein
MSKIKLLCALAAIAACLPVPASAQVRAKAYVACQPTGTTLQYDCTITLTNSRTGEPLSGVTMTVGADMPSMPMMHNVRPVAAAPGHEPGTYRARILLEMHGDWALQLNLSAPLRDRVVTNLRFEPDRVVPAAAAKTPARHKH